MPPLEAVWEGNSKASQTKILNLALVGRCLGRPFQALVKYLQLSFQTSTVSVDEYEDILSLKGHVRLVDMQQKILDDLIPRFVLCSKCRLPETDMSLTGKGKKQRIQYTCNACSHHEEDPMDHKACRVFLAELQRQALFDKSKKKLPRSRRLQKGEEERNQTVASKHFDTPEDSHKEAQEAKMSLVPSSEEGEWQNEEKKLKDALLDKDGKLDPMKHAEFHYPDGGNTTSAVWKIRSSSWTHSENTVSTSWTDSEPIVDKAKNTFAEAKAYKKPCKPDEFLRLMAKGTRVEDLPKMTIQEIEEEKRENAHKKWWNNSWDTISDPLERLGYLPAWKAIPWPDTSSESWDTNKTITGPREKIN